MYYKLDENKNVIPSSFEEWSDFIEGKLPTNYCHVGDEKIKGFRISTIFIGICHVWNDIYDPLVFETMVFDKKHHGIYQKRYSTWQEAEDGHKTAIDWVKNGCKDEEDI